MTETTTTEVVDFGPLNDLLQSIGETDVTPFVSLTDETSRAVANIPIETAVMTVAATSSERKTKPAVIIVDYFDSECGEIGQKPPRPCPQYRWNQWFRRSRHWNKERDITRRRWERERETQTRP